MTAIADRLARYFAWFIAALAFLFLAFGAYCRPEDPVAVGFAGAAFLIFLALQLNKKAAP